MGKPTKTYGKVSAFLSERMLRTAAMVSHGNRTADVGCDHAYTSIYLVTHGIAPYVVAMDVNAGPLARARENVERFGCEEEIELRLSDGLAALAPGEVDTVLIAGMGGPLMERILSACPDIVEGIKELVLQPQSEIEEVRRFLHGRGFRIMAEDMLFEEGKYYVILRAEPGSEETWSKEEYLFGKCLLASGSPVLLDFLKKEQEKTKVLYGELSCTDTAKANARTRELTCYLKQLQTAIERVEHRKTCR